MSEMVESAIKFEISSKIPFPFEFANKTTRVLKDVNFLEINKYAKINVCNFKAEDRFHL